MPTTRRTRQLTAVYDAVVGTRDHPSAESVFNRVREALPNVSLGTVYRNLQKLVASEQLKVIQLTDRTMRYDSTLEEHDHFVCERCGRVTDLVREESSFQADSLERAGYAVRTHNLTVRGRCPRCQKGLACAG